MKKLALGLCCFSLMSLAGPLWPDPDKAVTMNGSFLWTTRDYSGDIKAVFTPAGEGKWTVAFYFEFRKQDHVYEGTAEGSLETGELKGSVKNDNKQRNFSFEGSCQDGVFTGTHEEDGRNGKRETGNITLTRATEK